MKARKKTIAVCSSVSFYKDVVNIKKSLEKNFIVLIPDLAEIMDKENDFDINSHMKTFYKEGFIKGKGYAIREHFNKINKSDAILVVNKIKHGIKGYIGPNVLMEMGLAFYLRKPIFILHPVDRKSKFIDEISAMGPTYLKGNLKHINI